jgi:hypothetical protein
MELKIENIKQKKKEERKTYLDLTWPWSNLAAAQQQPRSSPKEPNRSPATPAQPDPRNASYKKEEKQVLLLP